MSRIAGLFGSLFSNIFEPNTSSNRLLSTYNWQQKDLPQFTYSLQQVEPYAAAPATTKTPEITCKEKNIADVPRLTVNEALAFFDEEPSITRPLQMLHEVGLGYLRPGQPATELSGGAAQRIKLATELQPLGRGNTLYIPDEPTTGLTPPTWRSCWCS